MAAAVKYSDEQVDIALATVVACGGSVRGAIKLLAEKDLKVPETTLRRWVDVQHVERYAKLAEQYGPQLEDAIVRQVRELAALASVAQRLALEQTEKELRDHAGLYGPDMTAKIARDLSHVVGQNVDKLLTLTGRPTEIIEERSVKEILSGPTLRGVVRVVDADVVDEPAELPAGEDA